MVTMLLWLRLVAVAGPEREFGGLGLRSDILRGRFFVGRTVVSLPWRRSSAA